jgi:cysteine desulfurase / selenocysteine lyase
MNTIDLMGEGLQLRTSKEIGMPDYAVLAESEEERATAADSKLPAARSHTPRMLNTLPRQARGMVAGGSHSVLGLRPAMGEGLHENMPRASPTFDLEPMGLAFEAFRRASPGFDSTRKLHPMHPPSALDIEAIRRHFSFPQRGRIVTNNAASTQPPSELVDLYRQLAPDYENVHRGQSDASRAMSSLFEQAYDDIASFLHAPDRHCIVVCRNVTEAHNAVMYSLMTEFRPGDNLVATMMEHNSNYVPWHALCREILPKFGVQVECRLARFDRDSGELDLAHMAQMVDSRTKLVCCTGASNFLGTKIPLAEVRSVARGSGYRQPNGDRGSRFLVDGAQLVPSTFVDVQALDADYLSFSFHKMLAPFGVGVLYAKRHLLSDSAPFLYGGEMIAEGKVYPDRVEYNALPWKFAAGTPNVLGTIVSAAGLRILLDLALAPNEYRYFGSRRPMTREAVAFAMNRISHYTRDLTRHALKAVAQLPGLKVYGPADADRRTSLLAFNVEGWDPFRLAEALNEAGVESRAGCHCATLAHRYLALEPPASCRLSFYLYNTVDDVDRAVDALTRIITS